MNVKEKKLGMAKLMGHQHHAEPVTESDHIMSKRHKAHRREIESDHKALLKKSIKYNEAHKKEHEKAEKKAYKELEKMEK